MGFFDIVLMISIIAGAVFIVYRSVWKKQGHCPGCDTGTCSVKGLNRGSNCH